MLLPYGYPRIQNRNAELGPLHQRIQAILDTYISSLEQLPISAFGEFQADQQGCTYDGIILLPFSTVKYCRDGLEITISRIQQRTISESEHNTSLNFLVISHNEQAKSKGINGEYTLTYNSLEGAILYKVVKQEKTQVPTYYDILDEGGDKIIEQLEQVVGELSHVSAQYSQIEITSQAHPHFNMNYVTVPVGVLFTLIIAGFCLRRKIEIMLS